MHGIGTPGREVIKAHEQRQRECQPGAEPDASDKSGDNAGDAVDQHQPGSHAAPGSADEFGQSDGRTQHRGGHIAEAEGESECHAVTPAAKEWRSRDASDEAVEAQAEWKQEIHSGETGRPAYN